MALRILTGLASTLVALMCSAPFSQAETQSSNGRMKAMRVSPVSDRHAPLAIRVDGPYRVNGREFTVSGAVLPLRAENGLSVETPQYIVGDGDGVAAIQTAPVSSGAALLATVYPKAGLGYAHHSWLTLYPPVDDKGATKRKASFDAGKWRIPGKDFAVGLPRSASLESLADLRNSPLVASGPFWEEKSGLFRFDHLVRPLPLTDFQLSGGNFMLNGSRRVQLRRFKLDLQGRFFGLQQSISAERSAPSFETVVEDCTITDSLAGKPDWTGNLDGVFLPGRTTIRRCLIENTQNGVQAPGAGLYEDIQIRHNGLRAGDHGASWMTFPIRDFVDQSGYAGHYRLSGFNFELPAASSRSWDHTETTAALSIWNDDITGYGLEDIVIERGLIDGGAYPIVVEPYRETRTGEPVLPIRNILIRNIWFTRNFEYSSPAGVISFHPPTGHFGPTWSNIIVCKLYWADTGEEIREATGVWNPGPDGNPIRTPIPKIDPITGRATGCT